METPSAQREGSWRLGLRQRVFVLVILVPGATLLIGLSALFMSEHARAEVEFREHLRSKAGVLALALADSCARGCLHEVDAPIELLLRNEPALLSVEVFDPREGTRLRAWGAAGPAFDPQTPSLSGGEVRLEEEAGHSSGLLHSSGHVFSTLTPLATGRWRGSATPVLRVRGRSLAANRRVISILGLGLIPGALVGGCGLLLALSLNRRWRSALASLQAATARIARGELSERVEVGTGDEFQDLGESINRMADALGEQRRDLDRNAEVLAERLDTRSRELETATAIALNQERIAAMGVLAAGVAHEIGNPLTAVSAVVQGMQRRGEGSAEKLQVLAENLERIQQIVHSLVGYARPPATTVQLVSINALLRKTLSLVRLDPRAKDLSLSEVLDPELPRVTSVEGQLQQIFLNLLLNALDALPEGRGEVRVETGFDGGDEVFVRIEDSGPGVPESLREKIFEAFFTTRAERGGTGLGLTVSASLCAALGARLSVAAGSLGGARFELRLPLGREEQG